MAEYQDDAQSIDEAEAMLGSFFGEGFPEQCKLARKGDGIVGHFVRVDEDVDLKTGFAPVDMLILRAITGVWHGDEGTERARKGTVYAVAMMHQTLRNRIAEAMPIDDDEVIAIRRGRVFKSSFNPGQEAVAYDVVLPDRETEAKAEAESKASSESTAHRTATAAKASPKGGAAKAAARATGKRGSRRTANEPTDPAEEPF
jgi:hypothetical protein